MYATIRTKEFSGRFRLEIIDSVDWPIQLSVYSEGCLIPVTVVAMTRKELRDLEAEIKFAFTELDRVEADRMLRDMDLDAG